MADDLFDLRDAAYTAGKGYDRAMGECNDALLSENLTEAAGAVARFNQRAKEYGATLVSLLGQLSNQPESQLMKDEITRTRAVLDLLDREIELVQSRFESLG